MAHIGVVIINYHGEDDTRRAVASALASTGVRVSAIVIDNEGDGAWANEEWNGNENVHVIANADNAGFGAACNQGIDKALKLGCDAVCLLNNDAAPAPDAMAILYESAQAGGLAAPKILRPDGSIYSAGGIVELTRARCRNRGHGEADLGQYDRPERFEFCSACVLMLMKNTLETSERFYEPFFLYYEDADLCLRLARRGCFVQYAPAAVATHGESRSTPASHSHRLIYYNSRNRWLLIIRNANLATKFISFCYLILITSIRASAFFLTGNPHHTRALIAGLTDAVKGKMDRRDL